MFNINLRHFGKTNAELTKELADLKAKSANMTPEEVEQMKKSLVDEATAEAAKILEDAKGKIDAAAAIEVANAPVERTIDDFLEERVPVMLYKDGEKYKDDVVLGINGEKCQIQRGKQVYVKRNFAMVLENQYRQQMIAADLTTQYVDEFKSREKVLS